MNQFLESLANYSQFIAQLLDRPEIEHSTLTVWSDSNYTGIAEGEILFVNGYRLRMREELDFDAGLITSYGYEVYRENIRLYWYDDFPHPNDLSLASTFPHHKQFPPNMKRNRVPAHQIDFERPNLPLLIDEIIGLLTLEDDQSSL